MKEMKLSKSNLQRKRRELIDAGYIVCQERVGKGGATSDIDYYLFKERGDRTSYAESVKGRNIGGVTDDHRGHRK